MHRFVLHNDKVREVSDKLLSPGQAGLLSGWGVFSTIRVADGVLFAWERHWARMKHDAERMRVPFPDDADAVRRLLLRLVQANEMQSATLRIAVVRNRGGMFEGPGVEGEFDLLAFTTDLKDWGEGVRLSVTPQARHSSCAFAGTKILAWAMNLVWLEEAQSRGYDETILLNERDEVSECTSANVFIAEGNRIWTPPLGSGCLPGVTRELLLHEIHVPGVEAGERNFRLAEVEKADEVFITSTTRNLLPVLSIEGMHVNRRPGPRRALEEAFSAYVAAYAAGHRDAVLSPGND